MRLRIVRRWAWALSSLARSAVSASRLAFSSATDAWLAMVSASSISVSVKARGSVKSMPIEPTTSRATISGTISNARVPRSVSRARSCTKAGSTWTSSDATGRRVRRTVSVDGLSTRLRRTAPDWGAVGCVSSTSRPVWSFS